MTGVEREQGDATEEANQSGSGARYRRASAKQLAHILNAVPHVIWTSGPEGQLDFVSEQWTHAYGGNPGELIGQGWIGLVHSGDVERTVLRWQQALIDAEPYQTEFRLKMPSGEFRWVLVTAKPEMNIAGKVRRWIGTCTDVHDRIVAKQALSEKERLYRSVLEASADCIKIVSLDGRVQLMKSVRPRLDGDRRLRDS